MKRVFQERDREEYDLIEKWGTTIGVNYTVKIFSDNKGAESINHIEIRSLFDAEKQIPINVTPTRTRKIQKELLQKEVLSLQLKNLRLQEKALRKKKLNSKKKLSPEKTSSLIKKVLLSRQINTEIEDFLK